jgi:streptomycin 6-kinase
LHEADGLRHWAGDGAVLLYDAYADGPTTALLLERCDPGTPLGSVRPEPEQDLVVADLLAHLWHAPAGGPFRPLASMCRWWADSAADKPPPEGADPGLMRAGLALFRELPATATRTVLLCTDLHAGNILAARRRPWLAIDPKPYLGDPAYDVLQHLINCRERLAADPGALADRMAGLLDLDPERVRRWLFARCVQESPEQPWLYPVAGKLA